MTTEYKSRLVCYYSKANTCPQWAMIVDESVEQFANNDYDQEMWEIQDLEGRFHTRHWINVPTHFIFPAHSWEKIKVDPKLKQEYEDTLMKQVEVKTVTITQEQRDAIREFTRAFRSGSFADTAKSASKMLELKCDEI